MAPDSNPASQGTDRARSRSFSELVRALGSDAARLVRQEIALARAEIRQALSVAAGAVGRVAVGAGIGGVGALTVLAGLIILVGQLIGVYWLSAIIFGVLLLAIGGWAAFAGIRKLQTVDPAPHAAIETSQDSARWAKAEAQELKSALLGKGDRSGRAGARAISLPAPGTAEFRPRTPAAESAATHGVAVVRRPEGEVSLSDEEEARRAEGEQPPPKKAGMIPFLKHVGKEIQEDEIPGQAAKLAYYAFMAMPPALMALFGLAGLVGSTRLAGWLEEQAAMALPTAVSENIVGPFIEQVVLEEAPGPFSIGLLLALWGGSAMFVGLIDTLNHAYDVEETRSFVQKRGLALAIMLGSVILFAAAAGALLVAPALVDALGLGQTGTFLWNLAQWPVAFLFMVAAFWCAYYFLPNRDQEGARMVLVKAAALAAGLWVLATAVFRVYIANFSSYSETYGFLGAFIILLLWLYVTGLVVLVGGELASEMEKRAS